MEEPLPTAKVGLNQTNKHDSPCVQAMGQRADCSDLNAGVASYKVCDLGQIILLLCTSVSSSIESRQ